LRISHYYVSGYNKADLLAPYQTPVISSDLTQEQADDLNTKYIAEIQRLQENAFKWRL
jgi:hypothetical protein